MPFCWRCTATALTALAFDLSGLTLAEEIWFAAALGIALTGVGSFLGWRSYFSDRKVSNPERVIGGATLGAGLWLCLSSIQALTA